MKKFKPFLIRHSPTILACVGAIGVVATAVLSARASPKVKTLLEEAEKEEELSFIEKVKIAVPVYIPTAISAGLTIACIFGANAIGAKQQRSLAGAYILLSHSFSQYREKLKELYGEEAHEKIMTEIVKDKCEDISVSTVGGWYSSSLDFGVDEKIRTFYDSYSGRYFDSTIGRVLQAEYHLNRNFSIGGMYAAINDFYEFLGLKPIRNGGIIGWNCEEGLVWIDFNHYKTVLDDGMEICVIEFCFDPTPLDGG